jgi:hypothetical protein
LKLYIVKGMLFYDKYDEVVEILDDMEEKQKCYVRNGKRINKNKIGVLEEGLFKGSYKIVLIDKNEVQNARKKIKEKIWQNKMKELETIQKEIQALENHHLESEIRFKEYY